MTDIFTPEKRSYIMSRIRSKNTGIDRIMNSVLADMGCEYVMYPKMFGNPDFVIPGGMVAIFCDGDFWHGYGYKNGDRRFPQKKFWRDKIEGNMRRDRKVSRKLRSEGWSVLRFWEHDVQKNRASCARRIRRKLDSRRTSAS